jgi:diacylglycerol kinase family enzyme
VQTIPAFINASSESADEIRAALATGGAFDIRETEPGKLAEVIPQAIEQGATRIAVAGGDGSLSTAANALAGTPVELAPIPGGTLNHLARDLGIPLELDEAVALARDGRAAPVDVGQVNDRVFLNTSSVGAYPLFVRTRERFEKRWGYRLASVFAALRLLYRLPLFDVTLLVEGERRTYRTPLVFIGVGERELQLPTLGSRREGGQPGLHVMVVRHRSGARLLAFALAAVARGVPSVTRTPALDAFLVDACTIAHQRRTIAVDGELVQEDGVLEYRRWPDALQVVQP